MMHNDKTHKKTMDRKKEPSSKADGGKFQAMTSKLSGKGAKNPRTFAAATSRSNGKKKFQKAGGK